MLDAKYQLQEANSKLPKLILEKLELQKINSIKKRYCTEENDLNVLVYLEIRTDYFS